MQQRQQTGGRGKAYLFLGVSLVAAVIAAVLVVNLLNRANQRVEQAKKPKETVDVVVATRNLYMGLPIREEDVVIAHLAPEMVPADVVFTSVDLVLGRTPRERVLANEILRSERLARKDKGIGLNALITPGKRAVSIAIRAEEAVAGFVQPGNYVDLIVVIKPDDKSTGARAVAKTLYQGLKVLAVGSSLSAPDADAPSDASSSKKKKKKSGGNSGLVKGKRTVTLEVTLEQAEDIALGAAKGDITLALRADIDITQVETQGATADTIIGFEKEPEKPMITMARKRQAQAAKEAGPQVDVVNGGNSTTVDVGDGGGIIDRSKKKRRNK